MGFGLLFVFYLLGGFGAGDVKFLAAIGRINGFGVSVESAEMQSEKIMMAKKMLSFLLVLFLSVSCISCEPPEEYELSEPGEYTRCYYDTDLESSAYSSAFIVYPCETYDYYQ